MLCKNSVDDKSINDHFAGNASLNANESVNVKPEVSHFKSEHYVLTDNYAGALVKRNESFNVRPNVKVSQSISVPVSCVANNAVIDDNES